MPVLLPLLYLFLKIYCEIIKPQMDSLIKENTRLVGLLKKVHSVSLEAYNDIIYLNGRVRELEDANVKTTEENQSLKSKLQSVDERQAALENISRAIKIAVSEFQKLKEQYDLELQRRQHAEEIVEILQEKIEKLESIIKSSAVHYANTPNLNNPYIKESAQLRNELLGVHRELRESIQQYETFKGQLNNKLDSSYASKRRGSVFSPVSDKEKSSSSYTQFYDGYKSGHTFLSSVVSPSSPEQVLENRLTQLKSLVGEMDVTLKSSPDGSSIRPAVYESSLKNLELSPPNGRRSSTIKSVIPTSSLDLQTPIVTTAESIVSSNVTSPNTRINRRASLNTGTVIRKPSIPEVTLNRPISPPKDGKTIQRISKFDAHFDELQDELLALRSPSLEHRP
eukprot:NODE_570_length_6597_cov_0.382271.p1 type:complete len:395 gc:universal NODE_570_length_6597_cov_0.382271:4474-3290(-)